MNDAPINAPSIETTIGYPVEFREINSLPLYMRRAIVKLSKDDRKNDAEIARLLSIPQEWVMMFTRSDPGETEH